MSQAEDLLGNEITVLPTGVGNFSIRIREAGGTEARILLSTKRMKNFLEEVTRLYYAHAAIED